MSWNNTIGGYFELELNDFGSIYYDDLVALNSGRNALEFILIQQEYKKIYIPYYICDVTLQPLKRQNIDYEFYFLDKDFYPINVTLKNNEALLYVNYFGIMNNQVKSITDKYNNIIIDNSQAFYEKPLINVDTFYSPRKFFGLPDGGFASCRVNSEMKLGKDISLNKMGHLLTRIDKDAESGYAQFKKNDKKLDNLPIKKMSRLTERLMRNISYERIKNKRKQNFNNLHQFLRKENELISVIDDNEYEAPMIYPFLKEGNQKTRKYLLENKIYTAVYWPNVKQWLDGKSQWETYLQENLIAIPVDQRYSMEELNKTISFLV